MIRSKPRILCIYRRRREEGQALVEFALVLPVLLLILLAIMKFGIMFNNYLTLTDAVRSGARQLALERGVPSPVNPCDPATAQANTAGASINLATQGHISFAFSGAEQCAVGNGTTWIQGDQATLTATYPCNLSVMGFNFLSGCTLSASATEAIE